ncbi:MAG TPA: 2-aminoethylphosphonate--pyruvate transaminase [Gammaproteobacteria bacterium]
MLLNPGPVTLTPRVRAALARPDLCHREPEFAALTQAIHRQLAAVYADSEHHAVVTLTGSGSAAVEAMLTTLVPPGGGVLVCCNGVYGERMASMLERAGRRVTRVEHAWTDALDLGRIDAALAADPGLGHVAAVHHETTTGRLNDLDGLAAVCRARGRGLLLDAVSSFGAERIDFAGWPLAGVAATANKCLHGVPGAAFVLAERAALEAAAGQATTLYLDLHAYWRSQRDGFSPFTQSTHAHVAFREALEEFAEAGGWPARHAAYTALATQLRDGLAALGVQMLLEPADCASALTAFHLPDGLGYAELHDRLRAAGFVIYAGQGALAARVFRLANMGALSAADLDRLLAECAGILAGE